MTRPDVERIRSVYDRLGQPEHVEVIADLCRYALAMEAAVSEHVRCLCGCEGHPPRLRKNPLCQRCAFDGAVERWAP